MLEQELKKFIKSYQDFPKNGILFRDFTPILRNPTLFDSLINEMAGLDIYKKADAIIAIDARGFIMGSSISLKLKKPLILARKPGKLPGELSTEKYSLEYGSNSLSIQKDSLDKYQSFVIVDDLLATGGTAACISKLLKSNEKEILGLNVVIELSELEGRNLFNFPVRAHVKY